MLRIHRLNQTSRLTCVAIMATLGMATYSPAWAEGDGSSKTVQKKAVQKETGKASIKDGQADKAQKPALQGPKATVDQENAAKEFGGSNRSRGDLNVQILQSMNLTPEQKLKLRNVVVDARTARQLWQKEHGDKIRQLEAQHREALKTKDKEKSSATLKALRELRDTAPKPADQIEKIRSILTPEQQAQFDAKLKAIQQKRKYESMTPAQKAQYRQEQAKKAAQKQREKKTSDGSMNMDGKPAGKKPSQEKSKDVGDETNRQTLDL